MASLYPLPASGGPNHLPTLAKLSSSHLPFLSPHPFLPCHTAFFLVAKGSLVQDHLERSHCPPMYQIFMGIPVGLWSLVYLSVPCLTPKGGPWIFGEPIASDSGTLSLACFSCALCL